MYLTSLSFSTWKALGCMLAKENMFLLLKALSFYLISHAVCKGEFGLFALPSLHATI